MSHDPAAESVNLRVQTQPRWWLIVCGVLLLGMPVIGVVATVFGMVSAFESVATSPTAPRPADLSDGISRALYFTLAGFLLAVVGMVLIVVGIVFRRRVD